MPEPIIPRDTWSARLTPLLEGSWWEARRQIMLASRMSADDDVWLLEDPHHPGDPAQKVDQHMHQHAASKLHAAIPGIQVFGEEAPMVQLLLSAHFPYVAYLDAIDGSAQAWAMPGAWGQVLIVQEFEGVGEDGRPRCAPRYLGVVDAEGGTTVFDASLDYVAVDMVDQAFEGGQVFDDELANEGDTIYEVTEQLTALVGGYKPKWWEPFVELRQALLREMPSAQVFNTAGAPVTRKVIQNADNVVIQLQASSLWDGAGAALIARAGGHVIPLGQVQPVTRDEVLAWWSHLGYEADPDGDGKKQRVAKLVPPFVAGMRLDRVQSVARLLMHAE